MVSLMKTDKLKASYSSTEKHTSSSLRSKNGIGFDFEDQISAWQLVNALSGEPAPGINEVVTKVQAQVKDLGWYIDDILLITQIDNAIQRLAISAKANVQVTASSLPTDFVTNAWKLWRDQDGPFQRNTDGMALVTNGINNTFNSTWREVQNACSGNDTELTMSRIRSSKNQSHLFNNVQKSGDASDEETIELIRHLHVIPTDWQFPNSENEVKVIAQCRRLLTSGCNDDAQKLWEKIIIEAKDVRLKPGTITVMGLISVLRGQFDLHHHPNFDNDWMKLANITADYKARIETKLPSGYQVPRTAEMSFLQKAIANDQLTMVYGEPGTGKSALVKLVLDNVYQSWNQVWFGPEELTTALSAAKRGMLPLRHELSQVLNATMKSRNVLVIDAAERIKPNEFVVIRQLLYTILSSDDKQAQDDWRVIIITQQQSLINYTEIKPEEQKVHFVEVQAIENDAVKLALLQSPTLGWLTAHDDTIKALANLQTLTWVFKAGAALKASPEAPISHTTISDYLWKYWTKDRADQQSLMMRLAQREALFEHSFALTDLEQSDTLTFTQKPEELPLRLNGSTNRIEFEHDLAADWARFQFLKQNWRDTSEWAALAKNPLWTNALRMLGQFLLRQMDKTNSAWDVAFKNTVAEKNDPASDILLDSLCLDPEAEYFLTKHIDLLLENNAKHLTQLLVRFHHIATTPSGDEVKSISAYSDISLYLETQYRSIILGRWPPVLRFLIAHREQLKELVSSALANVIKTWLTGTSRMLSDDTLMPFRKEMAEMALVMARNVQVKKGHGVILLDFEPSIYTAALSGAADIPNKIGKWALELAGRQEIDAKVKQRILKIEQKKAQKHAERMKSDVEFKKRHQKRKEQEWACRTIGFSGEKLPPWPLGARYQIDHDFRTACIKKNGIEYLMRGLPEIAAEILLALIIEDQPEQEYESFPLELNSPNINLGLASSNDGCPTIYWKSKFSAFLQIDSKIALTALIKLVNFCTERWVNETKKIMPKKPLMVQLLFTDGAKKTFAGWRDVYNWPQSSYSLSNGNLYCALDALEYWLISRLDVNDDIADDIERILKEGKSIAFVSVLVNVAKYRPSLLTGCLSFLLTSPYLYYWDSIRVNRIDKNFYEGSWNSYVKYPSNWILAPHRQQRFLKVVADIIVINDDVAQRIKEILPTWTLPDDRKESLEFEMILAALDSANYRGITDPKTGEIIYEIVYPETLCTEMNAWQSDNESIMTPIIMPLRCEERLQQGQLLTDTEATNLYDLLKSSIADAEEDNDNEKTTCLFAILGTLVALGENWMSQNPQKQQQVFKILRIGIEAIDRMESPRDELKFITYAVMHLWLTDKDNVEEWESAVLCLLTSGNMEAAKIVIEVAYANREQLGFTWWRLLLVGLFWAGLITLAPRQSDNDKIKITCKIWDKRLRNFSLSGKNITSDNIDFKRIAMGQERLDFLRQKRRYYLDNPRRQRSPEHREIGKLDNQLLGILFNWLIKGEGTGDLHLDTCLTLRIWDYDITSMKAHQKRKSDQCDLPNQYFGYDLLSKLAELTVTAPDKKQRDVWEQVLSHGPSAYYALHYFIISLFLRLEKGDDPIVFECIWREIIEYGFESNWSDVHWSLGESLIHDLLGFGSENSLSLLKFDAALRMKDIYKHWAINHLDRNKEGVIFFCHFLITEFGSPLRPDGLCWLSDMLKKSESSNYWDNEKTGEALIMLVTKVLSCDTQMLQQNTCTQQALLEITAKLATNNIPGAMSLQERINLLR